MGLASDITCLRTDEGFMYHCVVGELLRKHEKRADTLDTLRDERISPGLSPKEYLKLLKAEKPDRSEKVA